VVMCVAVQVADALLFRPPTTRALTTRGTTRLQSLPTEESILAMLSGAGMNVVEGSMQTTLAKRAASTAPAELEDDLIVELTFEDEEEVRLSVDKQGFRGREWAPHRVRHDRRTRRADSQLGPPNIRPSKEVQSTVQVTRFGCRRRTSSGSKEAGTCARGSFSLQKRSVSVNSCGSFL
jgi:hypothetical protein